MQELKRNLKNYLLIRYAKKKLIKKNNKLSKNIPWIKRKHLSNTIQGHCSVLVDSLINQSCELRFKENKFIIDKIFKYSLEKGENLLHANGQIKIIKPYLQLNSFIVYDEIINGIKEKKSKKTIIFNIEKQLAEIQEKIDSDIDAEQILQEKISA